MLLGNVVVIIVNLNSANAAPGLAPSNRVEYLSQVLTTEQGVIIIISAS